eukprot:g3242.t1
MSSKRGQPKNRAPAPIQITAEQMVLEATDLKLDYVPPKPKTYVVDKEEEEFIKLEKRKGFEDAVRRNQGHMGTWNKYAAWEESMGELERARSVYERAIGVNHKHISVWVRYAEMEMRHRFVNRARNVWDRAVTLLPRVDQLWYKYAFMEEMLEQLAAARGVFERWMAWEPEENGWMTYCNFEVRNDAWDRARRVMSRYVECHKFERTFLKWANWEMYKVTDAATAREVYGRGMQELPQDEISPKYFLSFAAFEEKCGEVERARAILKYGVGQFEQQAQKKSIEQALVSLEKRHGNVADIEEAVLSKRRNQYEEQLKEDPLEYDVWFDYARLEETHAKDALDQLKTEAQYADKGVDGHEIENDEFGTTKADTTSSDVAEALEARNNVLAPVRKVYERAIANLPPIAEKETWRRYIYLWIKYAIFEELVADNVPRTRAVYLEALRRIPHAEFTFAKVWILYAKFEIRCADLSAARRALGRALGQCPKHKLFRSYIELERSMGNVDRCRKLYTKYLEWAPHDEDVWVQYARLEGDVGEEERCRAVFNIAVEQDNIERPEVVWKAFIDYEISQGRIGLARALYERLLEQTSHIKVWMSLATFEEDVRNGRVASAMDETNISDGSPRLVRTVYERAYASMKEEENNEGRALIMAEWLKYEQSLGPQYASAEAISDLQSRTPQVVKRKRENLDGSDGWEEYFEYVFPEDKKKQSGNLRLLEVAAKWKARQKMVTEKTQEDVPPSKKGRVEE